MCGFVVANGQFSSEDLRKSLKLINFRGPDEENFRYESKLDTWFAHSRLSIRDLSMGSQPMVSQSGNSVIVFNGEIYNDEILRARLTRAGLRLRSTQNDTEVLLESLEMFGSEVVGELEGMFAFVYANMLEGTLTLSRDRFGQKPLFYAQTNRGLIAASESRCLHALNSFSVSTESIRDYFNYGYLVPPRTLAHGMYQLKPGEVIIYSASDRNRIQKSYWPGFKALQGGSAEVTLSEIDDAISISVARRLVADRPTGMLLSGGIDSALVAVHCSQQLDLPKSFSCVTVGFDHSSFDETKSATQIATKLNLSHRVTRFEETFSIADVVTLCRRLDEPLGDSSLLPTFRAFQSTRLSSVVTLTGDGGDELFLGYDPFRLLSQRVILRCLASPRTRELIKGLRNRFLVGDSRLNVAMLAQKLADLQGIGPYMVPALMSPLSQPDAQMLFGSDTSDEDRFSTHDDLWMPSDNLSIQDLQRWFLGVYLPGSVLTKVDRASMLNSVEARPAFLDNDLLRVALRIPPERNVSFLRSKLLLRQLLEHHGLGEISSLPKRGFGAPLSNMLRSNEVLDSMSQSVPGIDMGAARNFFSLHQSRRRDYRQFLYSFIALTNCVAFRAMVP